VFVAVFQGRAAHDDSGGVAILDYCPFDCAEFTPLQHRVDQCLQALHAAWGVDEFEQ